MWRKSGFALLELAVVAAFVSSISFTAYQVVRKGNEAACQNNLHQIYLALVNFQMDNGSLPNAVFFPSSPDDIKGINNLLKDSLSGNKAVFFCPLIPSELNKRGTNYLWNDTVSGKSLDGIPGSTWLMTEVTSISPDVPSPHSRGYQILRADGTVSVGPRINFPVVAAPSTKQPESSFTKQKPEPEAAAGQVKRPVKVRVENLPEKIVVGELRVKIVGYDESGKMAPVDKTVSIASVNGSIQPETVVLSKGVWEGDMSFSRSVGVDTVLVVDEEGAFFPAKVDVVPGLPEKIEILLPKNDLKAGKGFELEVLVQDKFGNICLVYEGKMKLECSDPTAQMQKMQPILLTGSQDPDQIGKFRLAFFKAGNQKIKATLQRDLNGDITGEKAFVVNPGAVDHFTIDRINSPKIAGEPFSVIIHSEDRWGNTVKGPYLSDTTGTLIVSRESYISGARVEEVLVTKASKETCLVVEDGNNHSGKSNPFEVKPAVSADIRLDGIPMVAVLGQEYKFKVLFSDRYGNEVSEYAGELEFMSSDHNFRSSREPSVIFGTPGKQVLMVKDKKTGLAYDWTIVVIR
ncbi:MAG: hypothetical protein WC338_04255 [Candidatus Ratteibacteria bacterium]